MFVFGIGASVVSDFIIPYLNFDLGIDESVIGLLVSAGYVFSMLIAYPGGRIADGHGPKPVIIIMVSMVFAATLLMPVFSTPYPAMAIYVALSAAFGLEMPSTTPYVHRITSASNRGIVMSVYMLSAYAGSIIGPPIGGFVSDAIGIRPLFFISAAICAASIPVLLLLPPMKSETDGEGRRRMLDFKDIKETLAVRGVPALILRGVTIQMVNGITMTVLSIFLITRLSLPLGLVGIIFGSSSVLGLIATPFGGKLSDRIGRKYPVIVGTSIGAFCFGLTPLALLVPGAEAKFALSLALYGLNGAAFGLSSPSLMALMSETMLEKKIGTGMGVYYSIATLGAVIGAPLAGILYKTHPALPFAAGGVTLLAAQIAFAYMVPETSGADKKTANC